MFVLYTMKVAIGFFGITRSLKYTIESIKNNIFNVLTMNNIEYEIFMHTYSLSNYKNIRTNETMNNVDNEEYKLLNANFVAIDEQDKIKEQINMRLYRTQADPWNTNYNSVDNFILAQYSKMRLTCMIDESKNNYDYILFVRPDCAYIEPFDVKFLQLVTDTTICIPDFHLYGKYNFNDRFCITNMKTYKLYGDVFRYLHNMSKKQPLHSETILGEIMKYYKLKVLNVPFKFARVRCNGAIVDNFKPTKISTIGMPNACD